MFGHFPLTWIVSSAMHDCAAVDAKVDAAATRARTVDSIAGLQIEFGSSDSTLWRVYEKMWEAQLFCPSSGKFARLLLFLQSSLKVYSAKCKFLL